MVTTRNRSGNPPPPPTRPLTIYGGGHHRFAATSIIDIQRSSESTPNAAPDPPPIYIRLDRRAPHSPSLSHHSSNFMMPAQGLARPSRPRQRQPSPSDTFSSMINMSQSQSMPDVHSAQSFMPGQDDNPDVNSKPVDIAPLMVWHHVYGFSGTFASGFPNPPPQPNPELYHSSHSRNSPPPSFAASFDAKDDHDDGDYHAHRRRGRAFPVSVDEVLQGYIDFKNEYAVHFRSIWHRRFHVCKYIPDHTIDSLHLRDVVMHYFDAIGWRSYVEIRYSTYYELVFEFYSTFTFLPNRVSSN